MSKPHKKPSARYDKRKSPETLEHRPPDAAKAQSERRPEADTTPSRVVSLEPLAPIIVRSGRPFDGQAGADPARFPPPSTLAGCLRTAWARATDRDFGLELAELPVAGPLLARPDQSGKLHLLVPKPADAIYLRRDAEIHCVRAEPRDFDEGTGSDLPDGLTPVRLTEDLKGKPAPGPAWWDWDDLMAYRQGQPRSLAELTQRGWSPPPGDRRTHVAIDPTTLTSDPGRLFQTEGLDFEPTNHWLQATAPGAGLRLLARCGKALPAALVHLGGERRLAALQPQPESAWPIPDPGWFERIANARGLTLTLLTPAFFGAGYRPGWLGDDGEGAPPLTPGLRLRLVAAAVTRWQPHSGWDLARRRPRPTRKLIGAGATYWLRLIGQPDPDALAALWLASLCDVEQDRRDGFGLALPAPWTPPPA